MKIFNQQLLILDYKVFSDRHYVNVLSQFMMAVTESLVFYFIYKLLINPQGELGFLEQIIITGFCTMIAGHILYAIILIRRMIKQKRLEQNNIVLQIIQPINEEFGNKLFYRLSKLYQLYIKRLKNNQLVDNQIKPLLIELDTQIYDTLMLLKNPKTLKNNQHLNSMDEKDNHEDNEQLQLLNMDKNPIYLKLYKEIIFKEEVEKMEKCFDEVQYDFQYYALHNVHYMIMTFKNDGINSLSEYEMRENEIWKILNKIKLKIAENKS